MIAVNYLDHSHLDKLYQGFVQECTTEDSRFF
jgi:hypothetical protein